MFYKVKTFIQNICNYPLEYRNIFRNFVISIWKENLNFKTFFIWFPVFFSISKTFYLKSQDNTFLNAVQKNVPGLTSQKTKIIFQNYENLFFNQLHFQTLCSPVSLDTTQLLENENSELNDKAKNFQFISDSCFKTIDFYNDFVLKKINLNLDELPTKIQDVSLSSDTTESRKIQVYKKLASLLNGENATKLHLIKSRIINDKFQKNFYNKNICPYENSINFNFEYKNQDFETEVFHEEDIVSWIIDEDTKISVLKLLKFLEKISVITKNYSILPRYMSGYILPDVDNESNVTMIGQSFYQRNNAFLYKIFSNFVWKHETSVSNINKLKYSLSFQIPTEFLHSNFKFQSCSFQLSSQPNTFTYFVKHVEKNKKKNKITFLERTYKGPSILQNTITNEASITNQKQVKEWFENFFNSENPLSDERKIFFGRNVYDSKIKNQKSYKKNKTPRFVHIPLIKDSIIVARKTNISKKRTAKIELFKATFKPSLRKYNKDGDLIGIKPCRRTTYKFESPVSTIKYRYIPYFTQSEFDKWKDEIKKQDLFPFFYVQYPKKNTVKLPINYFDNSYLKKFPKGSEVTLQVASPGSLIGKSALTYFGFGTKADFSSKRPFDSKDTCRVASLPKGFLSNREFNLKQTLLQNQRAENAYKKQHTVYNKIFKKTRIGSYSVISDKNKTRQFHKSFQEIIEPINSDSWLFITQLSIGLFFVQIFQSILKKYEKELISFFTVFIGEQNASLIETTSEDSNFRIIKNTNKTFYDIVGINTILPELSELVWFLRNSGQGLEKFLPSLLFPQINKLGTKIPKGILLTGPPGTGKTLLVQAIGGESEVPVLIESGSSLTTPETWETGPERLKNLFREARKIAPCIIFIDEIDTFGETRNEILENLFSNNEILDSIYANPKNLYQNGIKIQNNDFIPQPNFTETKSSNLLQNSSLSEDNLEKTIFSNSNNQVIDEINQNTQFQNRIKQEQRNVLMQLLIELDGIPVNNKILVFAATNRPQILDPALTRPGRFNKILELKLPNKQKRLEILKFYSKNLGIDMNVSWNYLANLTFGLSSADLASVINQSSMKAIQNETFHTIETIEYGIECITGYTTQKNQLKTFVQTKENSSSSLLFVNRLAYYQAGKAVVHTLLKFHPAVIAIHLWPQLKNPRYHLINRSIEKEFSQIHTRIQLESRIIGLYGGKAAEFLALFHGFKLNSNKNESSASVLFWQSDLGIQDINLAGCLAQMMISKWYFYSKKISIEKWTQLQENENYSAISDFGIFEFFKQLSSKTTQNSEIISSHKNSAFGSDASRTVTSPVALQRKGQNWITKPWLQKQITQKLELFYFHKNNWFKIYSGDHERNENTQIIFPDKYYHDNVNLNNTLDYKSQSAKNFLQKLPVSYVRSIQRVEEIQPITNQSLTINLNPMRAKAKYVSLFSSSLTWNNKNYLNRDYIFHSLILSCFNKAILILDKNRELVDLFASLLMQKEIIREDEISEMVEIFQNNQKNSNTQQIKRLKSKMNKKSKKNLKFVEKSWGKHSRKKKCRFLNFQTINK